MNEKISTKTILKLSSSEIRLTSLYGVSIAGVLDWNKNKNDLVNEMLLDPEINWVVTIDLSKWLKE